MNNFSNHHPGLINSSAMQIPPPSSLPTGSSKCLLFKNLPHCLSEEQATDLIKHFGARSVRYMGHHGQYKNTAFAEYPTIQAAQTALHHCHQINILGYLLKVEYATGKTVSHRPVIQWSTNSIHEEDIIGHKNEVPKENYSQKVSQPERRSKINYLSSDWDIPYPDNLHIRYGYPAPTENVLINIIHALATYPRFYTQALHLMNKMNLPPPFGLPTAEPPVAKEPISDEESELESEEEMRPTLFRNKRKKVKSAIPESLSKRLRLQVHRSVQAAAVSDAANRNDQKERIDLESVFEICNPAIKTGIPVQVPSQIPLPSVKLQPEKRDLVDQTVSVDGFGKFGRSTEASAAANTTSPSERRSQEDLLIPGAVTAEDLPLSKEPQGVPPHGSKHQPPKDKEKSATDASRQSETSNQKSISESELARGRLSEDDIKSHPVLSRSSTGEPTSRLYVKNLAKQTTYHNLQYIFSRYVDLKSDEEHELFKIQLMTSGRMKGQAFVTLPSVEAARKALLEVHGYVVNDKPMCISYAKSA